MVEKVFVLDDNLQQGRLLLERGINSPFNKDMDMTYRCPTGCHVSIVQGRCPHCGEWLLSWGRKSKEQAYKEISDEQIERMKSTGGQDMKHLTSSRARAFKERAQQEEKQYFHNLNKQHGN